MEMQCTLIEGIEAILRIWTTLIVRTYTFLCQNSRRRLCCIEITFYRAAKALSSYQLLVSKLNSNNIFI